MRPTLTATTPACAAAVPDPAFPRPGEIAQRLLAQVVVGRRCQRAMLAELQHAGLTDTQLLVLWGIEQLAPSTGGVGVGQSDIAQSLGISPAQTSGLVEQLRQQGHLDSCRAPHDRRQQLWHLTESGRSRLQQALSCVAKADLELLASDGFALLPVAWTSAPEERTQTPVPTVSLQHGEAA